MRQESRREKSEGRKGKGRKENEVYKVRRTMCMRQERTERKGRKGNTTEITKK